MDYAMHFYFFMLGPAQWLSTWLLLSQKRRFETMSPHLFIMAVEAISRMFHQSQTANQIRGIEINRQGPPIINNTFDVRR